MKNKLIVLSGPSGVGKGVIVDGLLSRGDYALSVSCTTRAPRPNEVDGKSYFFIGREKFEKMIEEGGFLEYSEHFGNLYGTPKEYVEKQLLKRNVILEIEVNGAMNVKSAHPGAILIMIAPPSKEELRRRLRGRGTETEDVIEMRIQRWEYEFSKATSYDYVVVNDNLERCLEEIEQIIAREKA